MAVRAAAEPPAPLVSVGCFLNRANLALRRRAGTGAEVALIIVGATEISDVRGTAGGPAGDEVVRAVADWVLAAPGPADSAMLMGGGELAILCGGVRESGETDTVVRRICDAMTQRFEVCGELGSVVTATGVAMASSPDDTAEELISAAGRAMRAARQWDTAGLALSVPAPRASLVPGTPSGRGDGSGQASAGRHASATAASAGMEVVEAVIHRLFDVGVMLESAAEMADGVVAAWIRAAAGELDAVVREARMAAFGEWGPACAGEGAAPGAGQAGAGQVRAAAPG